MHGTYQTSVYICFCRTWHHSWSFRGSEWRVEHKMPITHRLCPTYCDLCVKNAFLELIECVQHSRLFQKTWLIQNRYYFSSIRYYIAIKPQHLGGLHRSIRNIYYFCLTNRWVVLLQCIVTVTPYFNLYISFKPAVCYVIIDKPTEKQW